jgi:hypothetical protein
VDSKLYAKFESAWRRASRNAKFSDEETKALAKGWFFQAYMEFTQQETKMQKILDHYREILVDEGQVDDHEYHSEMWDLKREIISLRAQLEASQARRFT